MWGGGGSASAQPRPDVAIWVSADTVTAGEPFLINIESSTPAHRGIAFPPAADSVFGELEVLGRSDVHTRRVGAGHAIDSVSYTVRTSARDSVRIPPIPIRVDAATGTLTTFTKPRAAKVRARPQSAILNPFEQSASDPFRWLVLALVVSGALYGAVSRWTGVREERPSQEEPSPDTDQVDPDAYDDAARTLDELAARDLTDPATVEAVHVTLADVVRTYVSRRLGIATEDRTTEDLLAVLEHRSDVPPEALEALRPALEQADRVKFAATRPDPSDTEEALQAAVTALDVLKDTSSPVDSSHDTGRR